jgi:GT2 family glycosyltransferase
VDISIIIVSWNGRDLLARLIESIIKHPPSAPYEIVVVDNASTDGSVERLRAAQSNGLLKGTRLRLIENVENVGFGRANNIAFRQTDARMASKAGPIPEAIRQGVDGWLVPPADVQALADALCQLLKDEERRKRLGEAAAESARARFHPETAARKLEGLYESVIARPTKNVLRST